MAMADLLNLGRILSEGGREGRLLDAARNFELALPNPLMKPLPIMPAS